jgi:hypothetical protein
VWLTVSDSSGNAIFSNRPYLLSINSDCEPFTVGRFTADAGIDLSDKKMTWGIVDATGTTSAKEAMTEKAADPWELAAKDPFGVMGPTSPSPASDPTGLLDAPVLKTAGAATTAPSADPLGIYSGRPAGN